jgi:hypothetical protein
LCDQRLVLAASVDGDPIRDVRELRKLKTVYRGAVAYDPKALLAQVPQRDIKDAA